MKEGFRDRDKLVPTIARYLSKAVETDRRTDCIHPSAASHEDWCTRAAYYQIAGAEAEAVPRSVMMELVFERGHDSHDKWQRWAWDLGILRGMWRCRWCHLYWWGVSPQYCPRCDVGKDLLQYAEVPVSSPEHLLAGQADGEVFIGERWVPIEIKTIGSGTVRYEAPHFVEQYAYSYTDADGKQHSGTDWIALWNGVRRPFPAHLRQGMIYCFCKGWEEIIFVYEPKFLTAHPKEFLVKFRPDVVEPILEKCLQVKRSLDAQRPPKRPHWATPACKTCTNCPFKKVCWNGRNS